MYRYTVLVLTCVFSVALCKPQFNDYDYDAEPLGLPSGALQIFGNIATTFSCEGRIYGYYADEDLACQIFHICEPVFYPDGRSETIMHNFFCGNQTVFDQSLLVCNHASDAIPCSESANFYNLNELFGIIPESNRI